MQVYLIDGRILYKYDKVIVKTTYEVFMKKMLFGIAFVLASRMLLAGLFTGGTVKLAEDGTARAEIVIGNTPVIAAQFAALELQSHLKAITGVEFPIVTEDCRTKGKYPIFVGSQKMTDEKYKPGSFGEQEYVVDIGGKGIYLVGRDSASTAKVDVVYIDGPAVIASARNIPTKWDERGTLNAVYDFLRDDCGVRWIDCTEVGTVIPEKATLTVEKRKAKGAPFIRCRDAAVEPEEWMKRRSPEEWEKYRQIEYPTAYARSKDPRGLETMISLNRNVFGLRLKLGGERMHANHSFYWCYDRFYYTNNVNFIAYHRDWFSMHRNKQKQERAADGSVFSPVDTSIKPAQMCFSSEGFFQQTLEDIRAYFAIGGYTNRYTNQGVPCDAKHPVASWGKDVYCLEPMDNGAFCECDECQKQYRLERTDRGGRSDYWFGWVNKVAREIKKTNPDKKISTLAYGGSREGLPTFDLEDNVVVHFCWDSNRGPNRSDLFKSQTSNIRKWRERYPNAPMGLWLYNGFPHESGTWSGYLPMPGFFGELFDKEMKFIRDMNIRECIFNCGLRDDFELYLGGRLMWNPSEDYQTLKNDFFSSYGPAADPIRKFYEVIEERYCNTNYFEGSQSHMNRELSWGKLCTTNVMNQLGALMAEAENAVAVSGTEQQKKRVANWKAGYWDYMCKAKYPAKKLPSPKEGVSLTRTECYAAAEIPFGEKDILEGLPFSAKGSGGGFLWGLDKKTGDTPASFRAMTTEPGFLGFWNGSAPTSLVYRCDVKIKQLKRFRIVTNDPARSRFFFDLVGWRGDEKVTILENVFIPDAFYGRGCCLLDFEFAPGTAPENLDAIGIDERFFERKGEITNSPRYIRLRAADR